MTDNVFTKFLERQHTEGRALAANSDILKLMPVAGAPPQQYIAEYRCQGVIRDRDGRVVARREGRRRLPDQRPQDLLHELRRRHAFLVHGEPKAIAAMKDHIVSAHKAWQVEIPAYLQPFEM